MRRELERLFSLSRFMFSSDERERKKREIEGLRECSCYFKSDLSYNFSAAAFRFVCFFIHSSLPSPSSSSLHLLARTPAAPGGLESARHTLAPPKPNELESATRAG